MAQESSSSMEDNDYVSPNNSIPPHNPHNTSHNISHNPYMTSYNPCDAPHNPISSHNIIHSHRDNDMHPYESSLASLRFVEGSILIDLRNAHNQNVLNDVVSNISPYKPAYKRGRIQYNLSSINLLETIVARLEEKDITNRDHIKLLLNFIENNLNHIDNFVNIAPLFKKFLTWNGKLERKYRESVLNHFPLDIQEKLRLIINKDRLQ